MRKPSPNVEEGPELTAADSVTVVSALESALCPSPPPLKPQPCLTHQFTCFGASLCTDVIKTAAFGRLLLRVDQEESTIRPSLRAFLDLQWSSCC